MGESCLLLVELALIWSVRKGADQRFLKKNSAITPHHQHTPPPHPHPQAPVLHRYYGQWLVPSIIYRLISYKEPM